MLGNLWNLFFGSSSIPTIQDDHQIFSIYLLQKQILDFLPIRDLKSCRLVSFSWNAATTPILLQNSAVFLNILNFFGKYNSPGTHSHCDVTVDEEELKKYRRQGVEVFLYGTSPWPWTPIFILRGLQNLNIWIRGDSYPLVPNRSVYDLCRTYHTTLRELTFDLPVDSYYYARAFKVILPNLKALEKLNLGLHFPCMSKFPNILPTCPTTVRHLTLTLTLQNPTCQDASDIGYLDCEKLHICEAVKDFATIFPRLQSFTIPRTLLPFVQDKLVEAILLDEEVRTNLTELREIQILGEVYDHACFASFCQLRNPPLTSLAIGVMEGSPDWQETASLYEQLLWNHASTLKKLELKSYMFESGLAPGVVVIPVMLQLNTLLIHHEGWDDHNGAEYHLRFKFSQGRDRHSESGDYLNYAVQFPVLYSLSFQTTPFTRDPAELSDLETFAKIKPVLHTFIPLEQEPPILCATLRCFHISDLLDHTHEPDIKEYVKSIFHVFPNVHSPAFYEARNGMRD